MIASTAAPAWANELSGTGTRNDPFIIASAQDWQTFADSVNSGRSYYGEYIKLTSDLSSITTMVGNKSNAFQGTFLGDGHTISLSIDATTDTIAPFRYVKCAAIFSLNVSGTINANTLEYAAGIVGIADSILMAACRSSVTIKGSIDGDASYGGLISESKGDAMLFNCLFDGTIDSPGANYCAGFIAYDAKGENSLYNCLMSGTMSCNDYRSGTFGYYWNDLNLHSCYYRTKFGQTNNGIQTDAQGTELLELLGYGWQLKGNQVVPVTDVNDIRMSTFLETYTVYEYTAEPIMPEYKFIHLYHNTVEGKHYSVTISDSLGKTVPAMTDRGKYTITLTANEQEGLHGSINYQVYVTGLYMDSNGDCLIESDQDWEALAQAVNEFGYNDYYLIRLTNDISAKCTVGTLDNPFNGTIDGCGHTINLEIPDTNNVIAPFIAIKSATFTRLNVTGTYNNSQAIAISGFAAVVMDELNLNSCRSSIIATNTTKPQKTTVYSGFVSASTGKTKMNNCLFDGKLQAPDIRAVCGFIAISTGSSQINNCLMTGTLQGNTLKSGVFYTDIAANNNVNLNNCYHNSDFSLTQGTQTSATGNDLKLLLGDGWVVSNEGVVPSIDDKNVSTALEFLDSGKYYRYTGLPAKFRCLVVTSSYDLIWADTCFTRVIRNSQGQIVDEAIQVGDYTATFTGMGQYSSSFTFNFSIRDYVQPLEIDESVKEGENGFYYINLPKEDTLTLTLPDARIKQFKVYDSEGKDNEYVSNSRSGLIMHAPDGYIFKLTGTLLTEEIDPDDGDYYDYVNIYDGSTDKSPLLAGPLSCIDEDIPVNLGAIYSSGPEMMICFKADGSDVNKGLDFTVSLVNVNNLPLQDILIEDSPGGKIESDIKSARLTDTITLRVKPDPGYHIDSLSVIDKDGNSIKVSGGTWYNDIATFPMSDTAVTVKARFISNDTPLYVNMPYNNITAASDTIRLTSTNILSFKVYDSQGKDKNYLDDTKSSLVMFAPQGYIFKLTGTLLTEGLDPDEGYYYDYVNIYDGSTDNSPLLAGPLYCDDEDIPVDLGTIYSSGPVMMIFFKSDDCFNNEGLDFTVTLVPASDAPTLVEGTATQAAAGNEWYLPDGRRLQGAPAAGTLYLQHGRKVIQTDK